MTNSYNVMVDFSTRFPNDISDVLHGFQHIESIGRQKWQVGVGVRADTASEAYRKAVRVVQSQLEAYTVYSHSILGAEVYGPEDEHEVFNG
jgi:hypothetical protein